LSGTKLHAQFSGSVTLGGYHSTNTDVSTTNAGKDTATPDNVLNPSLDLIYNWDISAPAQAKFEASFSPNIFTVVPARSFDKIDLTATGNFYLSDIDEKAKPIPVIPHDTAKPSVVKHIDTVKPVIVITPEQKDISQITAGKLTQLSALIDSFDYDDKGISEDSSGIVSDVKDSVSEAILALGEILTSEVFTETVASVIGDETAHQKKIFSQVPMDPKIASVINGAFDSIIMLLKGAKPQSDILPVPKPKAEVMVPTPIAEPVPTEKNIIIAQAVQHLQSDEKKQAEETAPELTLINMQTEFKEISSQDISMREYLDPMTKKTLATDLTIAALYEGQNNKGVYKSYSYTQFELKPRLDLYAGKNFGAGITYDLTKVTFPFDSVHTNDGTENKFRLDMRYQLASWFVISAEGGFSTKNYDDPLKYYSPVKVKLKIVDTLVSTSANYSHYFLGGGLMFFPAERFSLSVTAAMTRSSSLRPYLIDSTRAALLGRSKLGGNQNDDIYSYDLTRLSFFTVLGIFWDLKLSFDAAYEDRLYSSQELARVATKLNPRPKPVTISREDTGPLFGFTLSREFLFDSRLVSIFDSFTPSFDIQSSNYTSTVKLFSYKDVTSTLSFEFGF
jgi:hypothetical protein